MNIAIFVSGNGTNCENIIRHFADGKASRVVLVLSSRPDAYAIKRAESLGIPVEVVPKDGFCNETRLMAVLKSYQVDFIVLAGFLLMVPSFLLLHYPHRIINIHPALLPKYGGCGMYGRHVHEAVFANHESETGITVHYVSEVCDGGEILFQAKTQLSPDDTPDEIAAKVHRLEMQYYPEVIERAIENEAPPLKE